MAELFKVKGTENVIEANQLTDSNVVAVALWCGGVAVKEHDALEHGRTFDAINVPTVNGVKRAQEGDWIIRRYQGDFYPIKDARFHELFESVE